MIYQPEWASDESPTKGMSTADMLKYYKSNSVKGWCRFYLADPGEMSDTLKDAIRELVDACATKETAAHRTRREQLRRLWQSESAARHATTTDWRAEAMEAQRIACERELGAA